MGVQLLHELLSEALSCVRYKQPDNESLHVFAINSQMNPYSIALLVSPRVSCIGTSRDCKRPEKADIMSEGGPAWSRQCLRRLSICSLFSWSFVCEIMTPHGLCGGSPCASVRCFRRFSTTSSFHMQVMYCQPLTRLPYLLEFRDLE